MTTVDLTAGISGATCGVYSCAELDDSGIDEARRTEHWWRSSGWDEALADIRAITKRRRHRVRSAANAAADVH